MIGIKELAENISSPSTSDMLADLHEAAMRCGTGDHPEDIQIHIDVCADFLQTLIQMNPDWLKIEEEKE